MFDDIVKHHVTTERISSFLSTALLEQKTLQQYLHFRPHSDGEVLMEQTLTSEIERCMRNIVIDNSEREANPCVNRNTPNEWYQPLVTFAEVWFIH